MGRSKIKPLPSPDVHHLNAAEGWLGLGNPREAEEELAKIKARYRRHPDVLAVRWHIESLAKNWAVCLDMAEAALQRAPERPEAWIHRSFTLHELKRTEEALLQLAPAVKRFPRVWTIPYNLACYCSQLGRFPEAREWFQKAAVLDPRAVRRAGRQDPDLKPLWTSLGVTI